MVQGELVRTSHVRTQSRQAHNMEGRLARQREAQAIVIAIICCGLATVGTLGVLLEQSRNVPPPWGEELRSDGIDCLDGSDTGSPAARMRQVNWPPTQ